MTLTLTPDTETRLRTVAEREGLDPAYLHEELLRRALAPFDDPLTPLPGRSAFETQMIRQWKESARTNAPFTLLLLDVDDFKRINDGNGHEVGDRLLRGIAVALLRETRARDFVARLGGNEFAIILPDTNAAGTDHIVRAIHAVMSGHFSDKSQPVTVSIGIAEAPPFAGTANDLLNRADREVFAAKQEKRAGRERAIPAALPEPEAEKSRAEKSVAARQAKNARLIALLDSFAEGDPEQQRRELAELEAGIEESRPGQRRVFGEGFNP